MIPKVIHYCWFGRNPKSELIQNCIRSWREQCPDYHIVEWNEENWDIDAYPYAWEAYDAGKWAFVSDVARLDILYRCGGIYLDTDVEILTKDPFHKFLERDAFCAFENERNIATGLCFGAVKDCELAYRLLDPYKDRHFNVEKLHPEINTVLNRPVFNAYLNVEWNDQHQVIRNVEILPIGMFNSFAKHHATRSWDPSQYRREPRKYKDTKLKRFLRQPVFFKFIENHFGEGRLLKMYTVCVYDLMENGLVYFLKRKLRKHKKK